ncbi:MAG: hypothetical protein ACKOA8_10100 [Deltaproteobacteria bacterium]
MKTPSDNPKNNPREKRFLKVGLLKLGFIRVSKILFLLRLGYLATILICLVLSPALAADAPPKTNIPEKTPPVKLPGGINEIAPLCKDSSRLHQNISVLERFNIIKDVPLKMVSSAPGHSNLRDPGTVVKMGNLIAASNDRGLTLFKQVTDKMILNIYTDSNARVIGIEVLDGNHRFAAGMYAEQLAATKGWLTIGNIPPEFLDIRVNGYNTNGQQLPRWVPLRTVTEGSFPKNSWREIPPEWGAKGPTAEIPGNIPATSEYFKLSDRGVSMEQVLDNALKSLSKPGDPLLKPPPPVAKPTPVPSPVTPPPVAKPTPVPSPVAPPSVETVVTPSPPAPNPVQQPVVPEPPPKIVCQNNSQIYSDNKILPPDQLKAVIGGRAGIAFRPVASAAGAVVLAPVLVYYGAGITELTGSPGLGSAAALGTVKGSVDFQY